MPVENGKSALEQMNQILAEKEAVIDKKKQELVDYRKELETFEAQLTQKTKELQENQKKLREEEASFKAYKQSEEERIDERWQELCTYEKNLQKSMEEVLLEKVNLQTQSRAQLEKELEEESAAKSDTEPLNLNALREAIGIEVVESKSTQESGQPADNQRTSSGQPNITQSEVTAVKEMPQMFIHIQTEVEKGFKVQKPYVLEMTSERLCMQVGKMELRVFDEEPYPEIHLVFNHKNAKADSKLQKMTASLARVLPDWAFDTETNQLVCRMRFDRNEEAKSVVKKVKDCIGKIEL